MTIQGCFFLFFFFNKKEVSLWVLIVIYISSIQKSTILEKNRFFSIIYAYFLLENYISKTPGIHILRAFETMWNQLEGMLKLHPVKHREKVQTRNPQDWDSENSSSKKSDSYSGQFYFGSSVSFLPFCDHGIPNVVWINTSFLQDIVNSGTYLLLANGGHMA